MDNVKENCGTEKTSVRRFLFSAKGRFTIAQFIIVQAAGLFVMSLLYALRQFTLQHHIAAVSLSGLAIAVPNLAMQVCGFVKRLHDLNFRGWFALLVFVPLVNILFLLALLTIPGDEGDNRFGAPHKGDSIL